MEPTLEQRLQQVQDRIEQACHDAGRDPSEVRLLAVSKTKPLEDIVQAYGAGQLHFGENYVQEWLEKDEQLGYLEGLQWHFIGHLQRNKCKWLAGRVSLIHSVHSLALAQELEKRTPDGHKQPILLQFNTGLEESKSGFVEAADALAVLTPEEPWQKLEIRGLMSIPPFDLDAEAVRPHFRQLRDLREQLQDHSGVALPELSMGMSQDLEVAIEEGSTFVRVGTAIFGARR